MSTPVEAESFKYSNWNLLFDREERSGFDSTESASESEISEGDFGPAKDDSWDMPSSDSDNENSLVGILPDTADQYAREKFYEQREKISKWIIDTRRRMSMLSHLYEVQLKTGQSYAREIAKLNAASVEYVYRKLDDLHIRVKKRNERQLPSYFMVYLLSNIVQQTDARIFFEPLIHTKVGHLLESWSLGNSFHFNNFDKLASYLKGYFKAKDESIKGLYTAWTKTPYFSPKRENALIREREYLEHMYLGFIQDVFEQTLTKNNRYMPSVLDLGQTSGKLMRTFLEEFRIPYSGPYKKILTDGRTKVQYFISSCVKIDSFCNSDLPLYGVYEFNLSSLEMRNDEAAIFANSLPTAPFWLTHIPPLFNASVDQMRGYLYHRS